MLDMLRGAGSSVASGVSGIIGGTRGRAISDIEDPLMSLINEARGVSSDVYRDISPKTRSEWLTYEAPGDEGFDWHSVARQAAPFAGNWGTAYSIYDLFN